MSINRRKFLVITGCTAAATLAGKQAFDAVAQNPATTEGEPTVPGRRWGMAIDLKKCQQQEDCTECITACNKCHNIPQFDNPKDEIKWIWKEPYKNAFIEQDNERLPKELLEKPVLLLCNHCANPPCVSVCPTKATWQRAEDGIIMMDWHRCIGCRYCMAACPYGSRSFNWRDPRPAIKEQVYNFPTRSRGVVEKCTFCAERLAENLEPACVEACPFDAMVFGDLNDPNSEIRKALSSEYSVRRKPQLGTGPEVYYLV